MLVEMLNILENFDLAALGHNSPDYIRTVCEAMKRATIDKDRHVGDPRFLDVPLAHLTDKAYAREPGGRDPRRRARRGAASSAPNAVPVNTTHLSVVDGDGNCVSMTHSLGMPSGVITDGLGFLYNGCMGVFDPRPGPRRQHRARQVALQRHVPDHRLRWRDRPELVLGAPGGTQIVMGVLQTILNVVDFGMSVGEAVAAPRFSSTGNPIDVSNRIRRSVARETGERGLRVIRNPYGHTIGWVHAVGIRPGRHAGGRRRSGPRRGGLRPWLKASQRCRNRARRGRDAPAART